MASKLNHRRATKALRRGADRALEAGFRPGSATALQWLASELQAPREERRLPQARRVR